jgi:hypothetical protein
MRSFAIILLCFTCLFAVAQQSSKKTYIISSNSASPLLYNHITTLDIQSGKSLEDLYSVDKKYSKRTTDRRSYEKDDNEDDQLKTPTGGSIAATAYDAKTNRLFYIPLQLSELRYMDLKESSPCFTYLQGQSLNLLHSKDDVANQITRMTIGSDGNGYALSNDGEHLIKFTTQGTPVIQDLGVLIDNPKNTVMVRSSCTSWGGDIVGCADGSLYLITVRNHVFKISLPSKKCDYVGMIKNLPEEFTSNGASVDENGELLVSCGTSLGKNFSPVYKVSLPSLSAQPVGKANAGIGNISDMASSNLLFQKPTKNIETGVVAFSQTVEADENNLPNITIFPNPVSRGKFQIRTANMKEKGEYKMILMDVNGKAVMEGKMNIGLKTSVNSFNFPSTHAKGVYFVQIADVFNRTIYSQQLIVE